jgi:hypothetical protein
MTTQRPTITAAVLALALLVCAAPVCAQFGGIVYDPTNYANAVLRYQQLQQQLSQLITTYTQIRTQYLLLLEQSQRLPYVMASRYFIERLPWRPLNYLGTYGTTVPWLDAVTTGDNALAAFASATETLGGYGTTLSNLAAAEAGRIRARVDRAQLQDGVASTALEAIGRLRLNESTVEQTLNNLEADSYGASADLHTQIAVLNKINAAGLTSARLTKDTNYLLVSLVEQQLLDATERREAVVEGLNAHAAFLAEAATLESASTGDTTTALSSFRIP